MGKKLTKEEFILRAREVHGWKYDYSKVNYRRADKDVVIICPKHGEFKQLPLNHLRGCQCPKCVNEEQSVKRKTTTKEFIDKAICIHGNKYDYSKVKYVDSHTKVCIVCPEHGEFYQVPNSHLSGSGCPKCGSEKISKSKFINEETAINRLIKARGDENFDYSLTKYSGYENNINIICKKHGIFTTRYKTFLNGCNCPECNIILSRDRYVSNKDEFINKARNIHGDKYDYSKVVYVNGKTKVCIICPEHGEFWQEPNSHLQGHGCPKCSNENLKKKQILDIGLFLERSNKIHNNKYDYSKVSYENLKERILIICPEHGEFWQEADSHMRGSGCPRCANKISKSEQEIYEFCQEKLTKVEIIQHDRSIISPYELDIYIPEKKIGIEYNGLIWHSEKFGKDKTYHLNKLEMCKAKGIKLIQIFEDEYVFHKEIVLSKLKHLLGIDDTLPKIPGRKCVVKEIDKSESQLFLNKYHIQGYSRSTVYLGCYHNNDLIAVMTFKRETKNSNNWELTRFASNYNHICQGVGGKLFKYFVREYNPEEVKSFADRRWTTDEENNIYTKIGFKFDGYTTPDYKYYNNSDGLIRQHKFNFRKTILNKKYNLPLSMTETEMTEQLGYSKIYDCGLIRYIWRNKDATS